MIVFLKSSVCLIGALFLVLGFAGMFAPEQFASGMGLGIASSEGAGTVRAMMGAHYLAMGAVCIFAVLRKAPVLLLPIGMIEAVMVFGRAMAALNGEFVAATFVPTGIELFVAVVLFLAVNKLPTNS